MGSRPPTSSSPPPQVVNGKPAPDLFLAAAGLLGLEPSACLAVEDAASGAEVRGGEADGIGGQCLSPTGSVSVPWQQMPLPSDHDRAQRCVSSQSRVTFPRVGDSICVVHDVIAWALVDMLIGSVPMSPAVGSPGWDAGGPHPLPGWLSVVG